MNAELLIFARCAGFAMKAPGLSHPSTPKYARLVFAGALTLVLAPCVPQPHVHGGALFAVAFVRETLLGAAVGVAAAVLYDGAYAAGRVLDDYLGVRAAVPSVTIASGSGFGRLLSLAFLAAFFLLGGMERLVPIFAHTFDRLPPGAAPTATSLAAFAEATATTIVESALAIIGPALGVAVCAQLALGLIGKVVPRCSTYLLTFPVVFAAALCAVAAGLPEALAQAAHPLFAFPVRAHE